jgi:hypothetical protein
MNTMIYLPIAAIAVVFVVVCAIIMRYFNHRTLLDIKQYMLEKGRLIAWNEVCEHIRVGRGTLLVDVIFKCVYWSSQRYCDAPDDTPHDALLTDCPRAVARTQQLRRSFPQIPIHEVHPHSVRIVVFGVDRTMQ